MAVPTGVSRRVAQCFVHLDAGQWEDALTQVFPAIDRTAKRRRPKGLVGERIREFFKEEELLMFGLTQGTWPSVVINVWDELKKKPVSVPDALYQFARTSIVHEGELDPRIKVNAEHYFEFGLESWNFPSQFIGAMALAVVLAPENARERVDGADRWITILGDTKHINDLWGTRDATVAALKRQRRGEALP